ncbi:MAG TPA: VWA domain-containing protein [Kofleriaceae bacterium]|nr:VWA domain-containing protein [Kofleriaceae bacterium]
MSRIQVISAACAFALAGIGSAFAQPKPRPAPPPPPPPPQELVVDIDVGEPIMMADQDGRAYIEIAITGFDGAGTRPPVNLALVIDRSGSMRGDRLEKAKMAALMVVDRLGPEDVLSVVTFDSDVEVLVPAGKVKDPETIRRTIMAISDRGQTALYAGVNTGLGQLKEHLIKTSVNRLILLSDGQANVGPSSPAELAQLGIEAGKMGIPVTTVGLGLGYNEDLMTQLALSSDGNHGFAETPDQLEEIFGHELGDVMSVVANDVIIEIELAPGITPVRGLNRPISINGRKAQLKLNQIYGKQTKNVIVEVAVPKGAAGKTRKLGDVAVAYRNLSTKKTAKVAETVAVAFDKSKTTVDKRANQRVMVGVSEALANERQKEAIALRDAGKRDAAKKMLEQNAAILREEGKKRGSAKLADFADEAAADAAEVEDDASWNANRKGMTKSTHAKAASQSW